MPTLVAVDARLAMVGDEITVSWNDPGNEGNEEADALANLGIDELL